MIVRRLGLLGTAVLLAGCPAVTSDPPPPPRAAEIAVAPPHALGALAAGTDAAPHPDSSPGGDMVDPDAPAAPPSAAPSAPAAAPPPSPPDAGMAL